MINLAGNQDADRYVTRELSVARIDRRMYDHGPRGEVPTQYFGVLCTASQPKQVAFTFHRAWYYWTVEGRVPLTTAKILYADPAGKEDVRVAGHCGCPPPEGWATYYDRDGYKLLTPKDYEKTMTFIRNPDYSDMFSEEDSRIRPSENREHDAAYAYVSTYHIDTEVGLRLFVDTLHHTGVLVSHDLR